MIKLPVDIEDMVVELHSYLSDLSREERKMVFELLVQGYSLDGGVIRDSHM